jgi:hypothetical protein
MFRIELSLDAMDILGWNGYLAQECLTNHAVVAVCVIWRDAPLVSPEKVDFFPWYLLSIWCLGKHLVETTWRAPPRKGYGKRAACLGQRDKTICCFFADRF